MSRRSTFVAALAVATLAAAACAMSPRRFSVYPHSPNFDLQREAFTNPQPLRGVGFADSVTGLLKMLQGESHYAPPAPLPTVVPDWPLLLRDEGGSRFIWFGHSTLLMRIGAQTVVVDPVVGNSVSPLAIHMKRFQPPAAPVADWPRADVVLLSHNHYDHFEEDTLRQLVQREGGAPLHFIVPLGLGAWLTPLGVAAADITELDWWEAAERAGVRYTLVPAWHNSGRGLRDGNKSFWGGFVVQHGDETIYYSSDSAYGAHFAEIAQHFPRIDIAFIENGQYDRRWPDNHLSPEQTAQVAAELQPRRVVPVHWGAYTMAYHRWDDPVRRSVPLLRERGVHELTPRLGQVFDVATPSEAWYLDVK